MIRPTTIATAQYPVEELENWAAYEAKLLRWVQTAARNGARLLVFPEYGSMELVSLFDDSVRKDLARQLAAMQDLHERFVDLHARLALEFKVYLVAGSFPVRIPGGAFRNRAYFFQPDGSFDYQDKMMMTRFETEEWLIEEGDRLKVFPTSLGTVGIAICYDSEFPLLARAQVESGAEILIVPSCTDTAQGYHRVRIGCQARAMESQCFVVHSALVGTVDWSAAIDVNVGRAAVYTPVDRGFPEDGVLKIGAWNAPGWVYTEIDLASLVATRRDGAVLNHRDWPASVKQSTRLGVQPKLKDRLQVQQMS